MTPPCRNPVSIATYPFNLLDKVGFTPLPRVWLGSTVLLDVFQRHQPKPGERIGLQSLGNDAERGSHCYHMVVDRPATLDFSPLGGEDDRAPWEREG